MGTRGFILYLMISAFSVAILCTFFLNTINAPLHASSLNPNSLSRNKHLSSSRRVWPKLKFGWRSVLATLICFLGSAVGTVGGVGGGGIFVPMLNLIVGFDTKSSAALSKCIIMGASASSVWYNLRVPHPSKAVPIIDYDLALFFQPMLLLGITIGVTLSVAFPFWLITILIVILFLGTSSRSFIEWTPLHIASCALCGVVGGIVGGLLGSGGGFVLGPLLLELGVIPQVASATATFVMMYSSSLSVIEFYLLKRFPIPYALYLISVSVIAGFWGQFFVRKLITLFKRGSIIVFILSAVIFASALTMGVAGAKKSLNMIEKHDYMGFLSICDRN